MSPIRLAFFANAMSNNSRKSAATVMLLGTTVCKYRVVPINYVTTNLSLVQEN